MAARHPMESSGCPWADDEPRTLSALHPDYSISEKKARGANEANEAGSRTRNTLEHLEVSSLLIRRLQKEESSLTI